jgi:hypothetical protein
MWGGDVGKSLGLWRKFNLTGAEGEWTFVLTDSRINSDDERLEVIKAYRNRLTLTLRMACLRIRAKPAPPQPADGPDVP